MVTNVKYLNPISFRFFDGIEWGLRDIDSAQSLQQLVGVIFLRHWQKIIWQKNLPEKTETEPDFSILGQGRSETHKGVFYMDMYLEMTVNPNYSFFLLASCPPKAQKLENMRTDFFYWVAK